jgi:flavin reductase (DIM6/NTAB) family NADH-FMN oxidoreductase RutF
VTATQRPSAVPGAGADARHVDGITFREVMGAVCTPVAVVTAMCGDRPHGTTVSAFSSLSLDPPMVVVSLDRDSELLRYVRRTRHFGVNLLASDQDGLALRFARKGDDKFDGVDWRLHGGVPRFVSCAGWLACSVTRLVRGGDHTLALGLVVDAEHMQAQPLTYHLRAFGTHTALGDVSGS